jgi:hypothetical protein
MPRRRRQPPVEPSLPLAVMASVRDVLKHEFRTSTLYRYRLYTRLREYPEPYVEVMDGPSWAERAHLSLKLSADHRCVELSRNAAYLLTAPQCRIAMDATDFTTQLVEKIRTHLPHWTKRHDSPSSDGQPQTAGGN